MSKLRCTAVYVRDQVRMNTVYCTCLLDISADMWTYAHCAVHFRGRY